MTYMYEIDFNMKHIYGISFSKNFAKSTMHMFQLVFFTRPCTYEQMESN